MRFNFNFVDHFRDQHGVVAAVVAELSSPGLLGGAVRLVPTQPRPLFCPLALGILSPL